MDTKGKGDKTKEAPAEEEPTETPPTEEELLVQLLQSMDYQTKNGNKVKGHESLSSNHLLGLYFSAGWCPPCREFTPVLAKFFLQLRERNAPFQVIFVPFDKTEEAAMSYFEGYHGNWLMVPYGSSAIQQLMDKFAIGSVPKLIIVTSQGQIISTKGRKEVEDKGIVAFRAWFEESGTQLSREQKILDGIPMKSSASAPADADHQPNAVNGS